MKTLFLTTIFFTMAALANARTWDLNQIMKNADPSETADLTKVLSDIDLKPANNGKSVSRVKRVTTGSIYDKAGVKAGDFVVIGSPNTSLQLKKNIDH